MTSSRVVTIVSADPRRVRVPARMTMICAGLVLMLGAAGCSKPADVIESGALLVRIHTPVEGPQPDELRVSIYDDGGVLFKDARIPESGVITPPASGQPLGTVLVQPGVSRGPMRVHVRGLSNGMRILDGVGRVPSDARQRGIFDLTMATKVPYDDDLDDVPDVIDDCLTEPDPDQTGCVGGDPAADAGATADAPAADAAGTIDDAGGSTGGGGGQGAGEGGGAGPATGGQGGLDATGGGVFTGGPTGSGGAAGGTTGADASVADALGTDVRTADGGAADGARKAPGATCTTSTDCASSFCVDKVCCRTACNLPCQACGSTGTCAAVVRAKDTPQCAGTNSCNAAGKCVAD